MTALREIAHDEELPCGVGCQFIARVAWPNGTGPQEPTYVCADPTHLRATARLIEQSTGRLGVFHPFQDDPQ